MLTHVFFFAGANRAYVDVYSSDDDDEDSIDREIRAEWDRDAEEMHRFIMGNAKNPRYKEGGETSSDDDQTSRRTMSPAPPEHKMHEAEKKIIKTYNKLETLRTFLRNHPDNKSAKNELKQLSNNLSTFAYRIRAWANHNGTSDVDQRVIDILTREKLFRRAS